MDKYAPTSISSFQSPLIALGQIDYLGYLIFSCFTGAFFISLELKKGNSILYNKLLLKLYRYN